MGRDDKEVSQGRAAVYVRMSTEHQQYSTSNQIDAIREYAKRRGLEIVKEYSDEGKSGLNIQGRDALGQMIKDVGGDDVADALRYLAATKARTVTQARLRGL